jgi:hypothetical protein
MTELLEKAVKAIRVLPPNVQDDIAQVVLLMAADASEDSIVLSPEERRAIDASKAAAQRGNFATNKCARLGRNAAVRVAEGRFHNYRKRRMLRSSSTAFSRRSFLLVKRGVEFQAQALRCQAVVVPRSDIRA